MKVHIKNRNIPYEFKLLDGRVLFRIEEARLSHEQFSGKMGPEVTRVHFDRGDGVAVLLYADASDDVVLIEQFRYPAFASESEPDHPKKGWLLEIVAGIKDGDGPAVARRELLEETGCELATPPEHLTTFYVSPGGTSERIELYLAHVRDIGGIQKQAGLAHEAEDIRPHRIPFPEALHMVEDGRIQDAKTIIALLLLKNRLGR